MTEKMIDVHIMYRTNRMKLDTRKVIYALLFFAIALNVTYGVWYNGLNGPFETTDGNDGGNDLLRFPLAELRAGDHFTVRQNLTLMFEGEGADSGFYSMQSTVHRDLSEGALSQRLSGEFSIEYIGNGSREVDLSGTIDRTTVSRFGNGPGIGADTVSTKVVASGPKSAQSTSNIEVTLPGSCRALPTMPWLMVTSEYDMLSLSDAGTLRTDISIDGMGFDLPGIDLSWDVRSINKEPEGPMMVLDAKAVSPAGFSISYVVGFRQGTAWPVLLDIMAEGVYRSDEGSFSINMRIREELASAEPGSGSSIAASSLLPKESTPAPGMVTEAAGPIPAMGEGESSFVFSPMEALGTAVDESSDVSRFVEGHGRGSLTPLRLIYSRNESRPAKEAWVWNVTLGAPGTVSWTPTCSFQVESPRLPGKVDLAKLELTGVQTGESAGYPSPGRSLITLSSHEILLRSTPFYESMFLGADHSPSFRLDIISRTDDGADPVSALFLSLLGMERSNARDLYISTAADRFDPKISYLVVIDGSDGAVVSLTKTEGAFPLLLGTYGFDLA